jgi:hypothetical protein
MRGAWIGFIGDASIASGATISASASACLDYLGMVSMQVKAVNEVGPDSNLEGGEDFRSFSEKVSFGQRAPSKAAQTRQQQTFAVKRREDHVA